MSEQQLILDDAFNHDNQPLDNNKAIAAANKARDHVNESTKAIRGGKTGIYILWIMLVLGMVVEIIPDPTLWFIPVAVYAFFALINGAGFYFVRTKAVLGFSICLGTYLVLIALNALGDPETLTKGIVVKGVVLYLLSKAIHHARQLPKRVKALKAVHFTEEDRATIEAHKELKKIHYLTKR